MKISSKWENLNSNNSYDRYQPSLGNNFREHRATNKIRDEVNLPQIKSKSLRHVK